MDSRFIDTIPMFSHLSEDEKMALSNILVRKTVAKHDLVVQKWYMSVRDCYDNIILRESVK